MPRTEIDAALAEIGESKIPLADFKRLLLIGLADRPTLLSGDGALARGGASDDVLPRRRQGSASAGSRLEGGIGVDSFDEDWTIVA